MKLTIVFTLIACLQVSASGNAQTVSISGKNLTLEKVFKEIRKQAGYEFVYKTKMLDKAKTVDINAKNLTVERVLEICFANQPFTYTIIDKTIVVKEKQTVDLQSTGISPNENAVISNETEKSPPIDVTGKVTDTDGNPLSGATVKVKGTSKGTTTNNDGVFVLKAVDENATLEISFVGYETYTIAVANKTAILASLKVKPENLNEVVINKGYYTEQQRLSVSNVGKVTSREIERQPVQNALLALEGRVPGLFITQNTGVPGGGVTVRIQGRNSIGNGNDPLYIIDGVPYFSQLPSTDGDAILTGSGGAPGVNANGNPLSYLNPGDIESVEVLKDADATAIYGSRAANGAILITTKKGKVGKMSFVAEMQTGWGKISRKWNLLNRRQYLDMRYEALKNDGIDINTQPINARYYDLKLWDTTRYTDWQKELIGGTAKYTTISSSVSGGTNNVQYLIGGTYNKETTVFPGDAYDQKASVHFNVSGVSNNQRIKIQFSGSYEADNNHLFFSDLTSYAVLTEPVAPALYKSDGTLNWAPTSTGTSSWINPVAELLKKYKNRTNNLISNLTLSYELSKGILLKSSFGYNSLQTTDFFGTPLIYTRPEDRPTTPRDAHYGNRDLNSWIWEPQINYSKRIGQSNLSVLAGTTIQQNNTNSFSISGSGYNSDEVLENLSAATQIVSTGQYITRYKYAAVFGRINYNLKDRYVVNVTARRDGSSRFGGDNQYHNFGSVGGAWIFTNEGFFAKQKLLGLGKLRFSYGTTGSDQIVDYSFMSLYNYRDAPALPYQNSIGTYPSGLPNPHIQWEEVRKFQTGIDLSFLKDRIVAGFTYALNHSSNQLINYVLPSIVGRPSILRNFPATVENTSWEVYLNSRNVINQLIWNTGINLTVPRNKLTSFPNISQSSYASGFAGVVIGQPLGVTKVPLSAGVDPATGRYTYYDSKGNVVTSPSFPNDYLGYINTAPKFYGGLQNNLSYKGFELDFLWQFVKQIALTRSTGLAVIPGMFFRDNSNQLTDVLKRWQKPGDITNIGFFTTKSNGLVGSDKSYTDASYLRLKNLSLGYNLSNKLLRAIRLKSCGLFFEGQNLLTITKWNGDPETRSFRTLPTLKVWTTGLRITL